MKIKIFYSWQSTTDLRFNKDFIRDCLDLAIDYIKSNTELKNLDFEILQGTDGLPGSPQMADKIFQRIKSCDIFVGDLSVANNQSKLQKLLSTFGIVKHKSFQNNNVLFEMGHANGTLGLDRIIGIINSKYGSPHNDPQKLPFDIRHIRFPLEYNYSKLSEKENVQKELVDKLVTAIKDTTLFVLNNQKDKYRPFKTWEDWNNNFQSNQKFRKNSFISGLMENVKHSLQKEDLNIRIIGLSGLGKSRILLEIFRPENLENVIPTLSNRVLYYDFQSKSTVDLAEFVHSLEENDDDRILVVDNCDIKYHRLLINSISNNSKLKFITIDSNPEELETDLDRNTTYINIKKEDLKEIVDEIVEHDFSYLKKDEIEKIKEFSQGIPLMATLLAESIKNGERNLGQLSDKELLNKLLGTRGTEEVPRKILKACSLFSYIGIEDGVLNHLEFIATNKNITSLDMEKTIVIDRFLETCKYFLKREIFESRGRFILMRPFPLALYLAEEWLETCTSSKMLEIIKNISEIENETDKISVSESFAKQMRYLSYNDKAVQIVDKLVNPSGPFYNAEVLNTQLGSRLFRSFVEVNPISTSQTLYNIFSKASISQLQDIKEGRRNLVLALQKLCFNKSSFELSSKVLFLFALAENESWANNSTGEFRHLFKIFLPGTEADLQQRFRLLEWCFQTENNPDKELSLSCAKSALDNSHFSRMMGAEQQGIRKLEDYKPESYDEIFDYYKNILELLITYVSNNSHISEKSIEIILGSLRSITRYGNFGLVKKYLTIIFELKNWQFSSGLKALKQVRKYEKEFLKINDLEILDSYINKLSDDSFHYRFTKGIEFLHLDMEDYSYDNELKYFELLAKEFLTGNYSWDEYFPYLFNIKQRFNYSFGIALYNILKDDKSKVDLFLKKLIVSLENIAENERNYNVVAGFIRNLNESQKTLFFKQIFRNDILKSSLFYFISSDESGHRYYKYIFKLLELGYKTEYIYNNNFYSLRNCSINERIEFYEKLLNFDVQAYSFILDSIHNSFYDVSVIDVDLQVYLKDIFYKFSNKLDFSDYRISHLVIKILKNAEECDFAKFINNEIISKISWENSHSLDGEISRIYEILISSYFDDIWPKLSNSLLGKDEKYIEFYGLKNILGSHVNSSVNRSVGVLFEGKIDQIFKWAKENSDSAPERLAQLIPVFAGNNDDFSQLHPIAIKLLDDLGGYNNVVSSFSSNMETFSWMGSTVPILENKKKVFKQLSIHKEAKVRDWAINRLSYIDKEIDFEKKRDEEMYL